MSKARISYNVQDLLIGNPLNKYEDPNFYGGLIRPGYTQPGNVSTGSGLIGWYDPSDKSTLMRSVNDSRVLSGIKSKSGLAADAEENVTYLSTISTSTSPSVGPNYTINNLPAMYFDGDDDYLMGAMGSDLDSEHTIFVVAEPQWADDGSDSVVDAGLINVSNTSSSSINYYRALTMHDNGAGHGKFYNYYGASDKWRKFNLISTPNHQPHIFTSKYSGGTSHGGTSFRINGIESDTTGSTPTNVNDCRYVWLGRFDNYWKGLIGEVLIYNRLLSGAETRTVENYLANKWGIFRQGKELGGEASAAPFGEDGSGWDPSKSFGGHFEVPQRINRVQSFQYNFSQERQDLSVLGKTHSLSRKAKSPTLVDGSFSYVIEGGQNERKIGFNVKDQVSSNTSKINFIKDFLDESRYYDGRNIYVVSNKTDDDVREQHSNHPVNVTGLNQLHDVIDPNINRYSLLCLQDCYVNSYSLKLSVGDFPTTDIGFSACNATFYASGSGFCAPRFNKETNKEEQTNKQLIIPKHYSESSPELSHPLRTFSAGDLNLKINKLKNIYTSDFESTDPGTSLWTAQGAVASTPGRAGLDGYWSMAFDGAGAGKHWLSLAKEHSGITANKKYKLTFKIKIPSTATNIDQIYIYDYYEHPSTGGNANTLGIITTKGSWISFEKEFTAHEYTDHLEMRALSGGSSSWTATSSDEFFVRDVVVTELNDEESPNFHSYPVESFDVDMTLNRDNTIHYLGNKRSSDMPIQFPIEINVNIELIPSGTSSGSFESVFTNDDLYDISITAKKDGTGIQPDINLTYDLVGFNLDSVSESINVGSNNSLNLSLSTQIDTEDLTKGFFMSGTISELEHNLIYDGGDTLTDSSSNPLVYSNHPLF